jgi:hypothetical protein
MRLLVVGMILMLGLGACDGPSEGPTDGQIVPYRAYAKTTMAAIEARHKAASLAPGLPDTIFAFDRETPRERLRMTYTGQSRAFAGERLDLAGDIMRSLGTADSFVNLYEREYEFTQAGKSYWLPFQARVASFMPKELQPGETVDVFAMTIGYSGRPGAVEPVVLAMDFQKPGRRPRPGT